MKLIKNPKLNKYNPSFIHIYKNNSKNKVQEKIYTICLLTTEEILLKTYDNEYKLDSKNLLRPNFINKGCLCVFHKFRTKIDNLIIIENNNSEKISILYKESEIDNYRDIITIYDKLPYDSLNNKEINSAKGKYILIQRIYNSLYLRFKYITIMINRLFKIILNTLIHIVRFSMERRPK